MYSPPRPSKKGSPAETIATIELMISDLESGITDEREAIRFYEHMIAIYGNRWRWIFEVILNEERKHLAKLLEAKRAVEEGGRKEFSARCK